jgi:endonuclease/exonuclease/phosphatase family metal-dependent hydrolase
MDRVLRLFTLFSLILTAGCASQVLRSRYPKSIGQECADGSGKLKVMTYNLGLAPGVVSMASARTQPVVEALKKHRDTDIICLQEVWKEETVHAVIEALGYPPEGVFRVDTRGRNEYPGLNTCTNDAIASLKNCAADRCSQVPDEEATTCAKRECGGKLKWLYLFNKPCLSCLVSLVGSPIDEIVKTCTGPGSCRAYGGQNGVVLLSKFPLKNVESVEIPSSGVNRLALMATVDVGGKEPIEVACTHITSEEAVPPLMSRFKSWSDEQKAQITVISKRLSDRAGTRPQLFLGDMNAGPDIPKANIIARTNETWRHIEAQGFLAPTVSLDRQYCTICSHNTLRKGAPNCVIDHVLLKDPPGGTDLVPTCSYPAMYEQVTVKGYDGTEVKTNLSDHFGVIVRFDVK